MVSDARKLYSSRWWTREAKAFLASRTRLCVPCLKAGKIKPAEAVDHIVPHRGDRELFFDRDNWQPICRACNSKKRWLDAT